MGSRYDAKVLRGVTLTQFSRAYNGPEAVGVEVPGPWEGPTADTIAQIDTDSGPNVIVVGPPMRTADGIDTLFAKNLGVEALFGTVWDSVSSYELLVFGDGLYRYLSEEPPLEDDGEVVFDESGDRLPEEPSWPDLDEAYIQHVFRGRCGIDPGNLHLYQTTWYSFGPPAEPEQQSPEVRPEPQSQPAHAEPRPDPAPETAAEAPGGLWSRVKRLLAGGS